MPYTSASASRRRFPVVHALLAVAMLFSGLSASAAKKKPTKTEEVVINISNEEVERNLTPDELRVWRDTLRQLEQAEADIETGEWLAKKQYSQFVEKSRIDADRKKGKAMAESGKAKLEGLNASLNQMKAKAVSNRDAQLKRFAAQQVAYEVDTLPLKEAVQAPTEALLYELWNQGYNKIYFGGAFVIDSARHLKSQELTTMLSEAISKYDGNRYTFEEEVTEFTIAPKKDSFEIDFEGRLTTLAKFKAAMIFVEVIYSPAESAGIYSLNALDLRSGKLIEQTLVLIPTSEENSDIIGVSVEEAPEVEVEETVAAATAEEGETEVAAEETEETTEVAANEATEGTMPEAISLSLDDKNNFIGRISPTAKQYLFSVEYIGEIDGFDHSAAIALNKAFLRSLGFQVDHFDLLAELFPPEVELDIADKANAVWRVTPLSPIDSAKGKFAIVAVSKQPNREASVEIGEMIIADDAGIPPQASKSN
ncbi:MAG: hypothetical protein AAFX93_06035 [Verrucomicrobiota bacterium]